MKPITSLISSMILLSLLMISSCKPSQDVASGKLLQKRKYTKGYHFRLPAQHEKKLAKLESPKSELRKNSLKSQTHFSIPAAHAESHFDETLSANITISPANIQTPAEHLSIEKTFESSGRTEHRIEKKIQKIEQKILKLQAEDPYVAADQDINIFAILGFVFSILGILLLVLLGFPFFMALLGIIFSAIGLAQINKGKGKGKAFAIVGLILGIITILLFWAVIVLIAAWLI